MVVDILSLMIKRAASLNLIEGFKKVYNGNACTINHLQFADELIVFSNDEVEQVQNLKGILLAFKLVSGLKVNFRKSAIVAVGDAQNAVECASCFGYNLTTFTMKYLGIPLSSRSKAVGDWDVIIQRFQKKLCSWQRKHLSKG
ncbi:uncharacterized protein LOC113352105 [Papaver somniferum]|uniref:uncharacterized protein LOC113352105 n=1 Tax=Papaver somniferum TaxID=3469 RepID=UPI000E6F47BC|nr:uncharacterized protein LOC113352105 [Papaver somniferum]